MNWSLRTEVGWNRYWRHICWNQVVLKLNPKMLTWSQEYMKLLGKRDFVDYDMHLSWTGLLVRGMKISYKWCKVKSSCKKLKDVKWFKKLVHVVKLFLKMLEIFLTNSGNLSCIVCKVMLGEQFPTMQGNPWMFSHMWRSLSVVPSLHLIPQK